MLELCPVTEHLNADLRHPYNTLADWVSKVRSKKDRLTPQKFTRLDELGFFCRSHNSTLMSQEHL